MKIAEKVLLFGIVVLVSCGCATGKYNLDKTVWFNVEPSENKGLQGTVVTSLYFVSDNNVNIYSSVMVDSTVVVKPFLWAVGEYKTDGKHMKNRALSISAETMTNEFVLYNGVYRKDGTMILLSDSVATVYNRLPNVKLP